MFTRPLFHRRCLSGFIFAIALSATASFGQEVYTNWSYSAKIYLNTTAGGANITSTITNFPVLVRLNTNNFPFSQALSLGADVRFANSAGKHLPYQIEHWADNSAAEIWVNVDQITGNNATQYILMYWGKTGSVDSSKGSAVFDTANGFKGVWHMGENPAPVLDATIDKYNGTKGGNMSPTTGIIGNAQVFNGSSDYAEMGNVLNPPSSNLFTVSAWVKRNAVGLHTLMAKSNGNNPSATYGWIFTFDPSDYLQVYVASGGAAWGDAATFRVGSNATITDLTSWHHVAAVIDKSGNSNCRIYIDGVDQTGSVSGNITGVGAISNTLNFRLATQSNNACYFNGIMDEATVSFRTRSADWIKLCYQNQKSNQSFVTVVENYSTWAHSTQFSINTSSSGANIAGTLTNFPLLIRLTAANFSAINQTLSGGADVRFSKANGMPLSYQIERWVDNTSAEIWVKVDTILGNNSSQSITMYWGKTGAVNMGRSPMVFDTANGFAGVWHLAEAGNTTPGGYKDATINANNGTGTATGSASIAGAIGMAQTFDGTNDYITVANNTSLNVTKITASVWIYATVLGGRLIDKETAGGSDGYNFDTFNSKIRLCASGCTAGATSLTTGSWFYVAVTNDGTTTSEYVNGTIDGSAATYTVPTNALNLRIGAAASDASAKFNGIIDEPVVSKVVRSADWIKLCYQNQKPGSSIVCSGAPAITAQPSDANVKSGDSASFTVMASGTNNSYQWQRSMNSGSTWTNVTVGVGGTSSTYKFKTDSTVDLNAQFHCVITSCGTVTSSAAKLTFAVCSGGTPGITVQPSDAMAKAGDSATFTLTATGTSFQWQRSVNNGSTWSNVTVGAGGTTLTYKFKTDSTLDLNAQYRCVVTACGSLTSNVAKLVFCGITTQPVNAVGVKVGDSASFTVAVTASTPAYQWQRLRSGGAWTGITGQTAAACKTKIDTVDTGSLYRCVVTTGCGTYTSNQVGVIACFPITITGQPGNQIGVAVGQTATFQVTASGYHLSYQWQRSADGTTWSSASGAGTTGSTYSFTVAAADNNVKFRCRVGDTCASQFSAAATLTVCAAPVVSVQPVSTLSVAESQSATFQITATGTNPTYKWQRMNSGGTTWDSIPTATDMAYTIIAKLSDNGAQFRCVVTGKCGTATSTAATLTVNAKARANFSMTIDGKVDSIGPNPCTVQLADLSTGGITSWIWSYGDGKKNDTGTSAGAGKSHLFDTTGVYVIKLIVQGPGGTDSMSRIVTVYSKNGNPIVISGRFLAPDSVILDFTRFGSLNALPQSPPTVASIKLWYQPGALPDTVNAKLLKSYPLSTLKAGGTVYTDRVRPDMQGSPFTTCGFMTQIVWDGSLAPTPFASNNGCIVSMRDTLRPKNKLVVSGSYTPADIVTFYFDSVQTIDTLADSIGLWYGIGGDSVPNFTSRTNPNTQWWKATDIKAAPGNRFTYVKQSSQFNTGRNDLHIDVVIKSRNKVLSDTARGTCRIGRDRPINPIVLRATADTGASSIILLSWNNISADNVEKIRIYYRSGSAIPLQNDFTGLGLDSVVLIPPNLSDTLFTVSKLAEQTKYYFGAQIYKNGLWSDVTIPSSATDSTVSARLSSIHNTLKVKSGAFDPATNHLQVSWTFTADAVTHLSDTLYIGYSYSTTGGNPLNTTVRRVDSVKTDTGSVTLDLGDSLLFNTDYYVYLWLKKVNQKWKDPTDSSTATIHSPAFVWQTVHYNFTNNSGGDTSFWANGQVRFVTPNVPATQVQIRTGTIQKFTDTITNLAGFIDVGQSFSFTKKEQSEAFEVGLKSSQPGRWRETFIYRFDASSGKWLIDLSTRPDTVNGYVYVLTNQFDMPFAALIDTQPPSVTMVGIKHTGPVDKNTSVLDTIAVSDNVGNLTWMFQSARGGEPYSRGSKVDTILTNGSDIAKVAIPGLYTGEDNGAVARFICDDGRFKDTVDFSCQVIRNSSDARPTSELKWVPLRVTAVLDDPSAKQLLRFVDSTNPKYNDIYARLFRRYPDASNIAKPDRWLEYTKAPDSIFDFVSGRLMWMKTRKGTVVNFGKAVTMPQTVPVTVPLFAREWTDFALPYRYNNMRLGDILDATRAGGVNADTLQIYSWFRDSTGRFVPKQFYLSKIPSLNSPGGLMSCVGDAVGFTVFNPLGSDVKLVIPPISDLMSTYSGLKAKSSTGASTNRWAIQVLPKTADGAVLTPVYCGYTANRSESKTLYPVAPGFDGVGVSVVDENSGAVYGNKMVSGLNGGGCAYLLKFSNDAETAQTINFTLEQKGAFPSAMKVAVYNSLTQETVAPGAGGLSVPVGGESHEYRWLLVGNAQYIASSARDRIGPKLALERVYPNPVRSFAHLMYTLPYGKVANVDFTVLDMMGRTVWHKSIKESSISGGHRDYVWYGTAANGRRVAAGVYVLSMVARDPKGRSIGSFDRRLTVLP